MNPYIWVPATLALVYRAHSRKSLTPGGLVAAVITAICHASHPWSVFFTLLVVFFLAGTAVTKVKHEVKATLTKSVAGTGGEGPRGWIQVFANSGVASVLILLHSLKISFSEENEFCFPREITVDDVLVFGIIGNYVAVAADTFSSELGILATSPPRLITAPWKVVPKGTNGGVTLTGLLAGFLGSFILSVTAAALLPFCSDYNPHRVLFFGTGKVIPWTIADKALFVLIFSGVGLVGSLLDSLLGSLLQASVVDRSSGKVIEGLGGRKVILPSGSSSTEKDKSKDMSIAVGWDILSNNGVNVVMAGIMSAVSIYGSCYIFGINAGEVFE